MASQSPLQKESKEKNQSPNTPHRHLTRHTPIHTQGNHTYQQNRNLRRGGKQRGELTGSVQQYHNHIHRMSCNLS